MLHGRIRAGDIMPTDQSVEIRRRKREICNMIHHSTWMVEVFIIFSSIVCHFLSMVLDPYLTQCISDRVELMFARIIVPFTSLFDERRIKIVVMERGWIYAIKIALRWKHFSEIVPNQNIPMPLGNDERPQNPPSPRKDIALVVRALQRLQPNNDQKRITRNHPLPLSNETGGFHSSSSSAAKNQSTNVLPNAIPEDSA